MKIRITNPESYGAKRFECFGCEYTFIAPFTMQSCSHCGERENFWEMD